MSATQHDSSTARLIGTGQHIGQRIGRARRIGRGLAAAGGALAVLVAGLALPAAAEPATPVDYTSGSTATRANDLGFDTCDAPSLAALNAWQGTSPYDVVNIYFGGINRGCAAQPNLTPTWVRGAVQAGWKLLPTYFGYQPTCMFGTKPNRYDANSATARGSSDGADAVARAQALGLLSGSGLYADVEHYDRTDASCRTAVRRYVSAWTKTLHDSGYLAGVYVHQDSGLRDLSDTYDSTSYARPDAVWMARWDGNSSLTGWPTAPDSQWSYYQRAKQYQGDHDETWGGVTINIDSDNVRAPVATTARNYSVTSTSALNGRSGPSSSYPVVRTYAPGATLAVVCQTSGQRVGTTSVWDRLTDGAWVSDRYVSTPSSTGFSSALPRCAYPGQVTVDLTARTGPGTSYPASGSPLRKGALAYVACQKVGTQIRTTRVWDQLRDGRWVSDYYVSNRSNTTWSAPVPRCP
ncbi:glycoside hydrolase domain-containing protein [Promicromonospora sukumoe]|uniref:glycoside hydrolase domain-containing protein n=1 Tax=Promicromonospora sukumoe TaxID=88382 RepID=UPI00037755C5|nr:glycoside hydrolase domain-containing protein [Promicromonospora sukumoe]